MERITQTERHRAQTFWASSASRAVEEEMEQLPHDNVTTNNTFTPGEGASAEESFVVNFTKEQKEQIRQMVANAKSSLEIEEIERSVKRGVFPGKTAAVATTNGNNNNSNNTRKRPIPGDEATTTKTTNTEISKKQRTDS
jgi:hypothetical protein